MRKLKLLVVDDEFAMTQLVTDVAENMNFECLSISDPHQFYAIYSAEIDIVVLDLFMPNIDGIELLRFLSDKNSQASILLMSGKDKSVLRSAQELALERNLTVLGALKKPFSVIALENMLLRYVGRPKIKPSGLNEALSVGDIQKALDRGELFVDYQPQVKMADRTLVGVEALARWRHPTRGLIPPGLFIPLAEESGPIREVTSFVSKTAILQQAQWREKGLDIGMSINMSQTNLNDLDLPEQMTNYALEVGSNTDRIVIEVTETALTSDIAGYMDILSRLRMKNFKLSIDDFGTGFSSLQQLVRIPFTELKIDQSFVRKMGTDNECRTIAEVSILLAHKLGMKVVAEGIEHESEWDTLKEMGCDVGQGYWMGMPMPANEIEAWRDDWSNR